MTVNDLRTIFSVKWPIRVVNKGRRGIRYEVNTSKLLNIQPFLNNANHRLTEKNVKSKPKKRKKKKRKSRAEQRKIYEELLDSGKVKNQSEIARKFGVSRAWVSKVLS